MGQPAHVQLDKHTQAQGTYLHQLNAIVLTFHGAPYPNHYNGQQTLTYSVACSVDLQ
jgi:hypothetical protein